MESTKPQGIKPKNNDSKALHLFHAIAVLMVLAGAGLSVGFTIHAGRGNTVLLLILLFAGWVVSPFIGLLLINTVNRRTDIFDRLILYGLMVLITIGSLVIYSGLWNPPGADAAFIFSVHPLLSWAFIGAVLLALKLSPSK